MCKDFQRSTWKYDQGYYNELRVSLTNFNRNRLYDKDTEKKKNANVIAYTYILSKKINVKPQEPPWMNCAMKTEIRRRKRLYRNTKLSYNRHFFPNHWSIFKPVKNHVIALIRQSKSNCYELLCLQVKSGSLSSRDWWKTLKSDVFTESDVYSPVMIDINIVVSLR